MKTKNQTYYGLTVTFDNAGNVTGQEQKPVFRDTVTAGGIINGNHLDPNPWNYKVTELRHWKGSMKSWSTAYPQFGTTQVGYFDYLNNVGTEFGPSWDRSLVYNMALSRLNEKVRGDLDLGLSLIEAASTGRMIKALAPLSNLKNLSGWGSTRDVANGWLSWQYGWKPLMQDVFKAADESTRSTMNLLQKVRASASLPLPGSYKCVRSIGNSNAYFSGRGWGSGKQSCRISLTVETGFDLARWSSMNPASFAWEAIPYSFVVDWLIGVGGYLRNLETAVFYRSRFVKGYVSEIFAYDGIEYMPYQQILILPSANRILYNAEAHVRKREFYRTKLTSYPLPRLPGFRVNLSSERVLSAGALLRTFFSEGHLWKGMK